MKASKNCYIIILLKSCQVFIIILSQMGAKGTGGKVIMLPTVLLFGYVQVLKFNVFNNMGFVCSKLIAAYIGV